MLVYYDHSGFSASTQNMKTCKSIRSASSFTCIGLSGLAITIALNVVAFFFFKRASAAYLSDEWGSAWFPLYSLWLIFAIIGIASFCWRKQGDTKAEA
jgi:uncharacterized membrane protein